MTDSKKASIEALKSTITSIEENLRLLKGQLALLEAEELRPTNSRPSNTNRPNGPVPQPQTRLPHSGKELSLDLEEFKRYGRQMILPGFGIQGKDSV